MIKKVTVYIFWIIGYYTVFMNLELQAMGRRGSYSKLTLTQLANATTENYDPEIFLQPDKRNGLPDNIQKHLDTLKEIQALDWQKSRLEAEARALNEKRFSQLLKESLEIKENKRKQNILYSKNQEDYQKIMEYNNRKNNKLDELYETLNNLNRLIKRDDIENKDLLEKYISENSALPGLKSGASAFEAFPTNLNGETFTILVIGC